MENNILFISVSPRKKGTSVMLLERIRRECPGDIAYLYQEDPQTLLSKMQSADTIVISGPCYINTYPALLIRLLEEAGKKAPWQGQKLYGMINGGMPYIHTHRSGLSCLEIFCEQCGLTWMGGFVLGGGAMLDGAPLEKHLRAKHVVSAFDTFIGKIKNQKISPVSLYTDAQKPPGKIMTHVIAKLLSTMVGRKIKKHGFDPSQKSPYVR